MKNSFKYTDKSLYEHLKFLFPICRSITGKGIRETLDYFEKYHKEFERIKFRSGSKAFDWEIPKEWNVNNAYLEHIDSGQRYAEFTKNNLHLVSYSVPISKIMDLRDLQERIHTHKYDENLIPYKTSYYKENWGFCISKKEKKNMKQGKYKVIIESELKQGSLDLSHAILKGDTKNEILFSSYVCHPSMANNELSGPVILNGLLEYIKTKYKERQYTYRFIMQPETIGSIAYLSKFKDVLKKNVICGFNLSCLGDERCYSYVNTPFNDTIADKAIDAATFKLKKRKVYKFLERGSDERQYCSPLIRLPICTFSRSKFGEYPEYHTNADDLTLVSQKGLSDSLKVLKNIVDAFEMGLFPKIKNYCEPQLGKRNLYPNIGGALSKDFSIKRRMDFLAYCDGETNIFDICKLIDHDLENVLKEYKILRQFELIE